jgi:hypothetical protein
MFVHFVLILESSCSFRLKRPQLVLGVIVALAFNTVGFRGVDCQVSPVRSLKALFGSQSLPFPVVTILLVTRQHNIQPYCWNCAMTGSVAQLRPRMSSITPEQRSTMTNQPSPFHGPTTPAPFVFDDQSKVLYVRLQYGSLLPYEIQDQDIPFIPIDLSRIAYWQDFIKNDHLINPTQSRKSCVAQESNAGH